ncbi:Biotin--protein ligase [Oryzias melastigma]|uniref:Biotin--protein ligase n=1 Tax=Oryzias melastigma TaxID=30732 RepID=A0A834CBX1_ORYME|nr:Biotin--protein ligase [Oryzias melastigma]
MLITLCYVYMWVRFHKCYSVLIRNSLFRLRSSSSHFCFSFCPSSVSAPASVPAAPAGPHAAAPRLILGSSANEDHVFLQLGDKAVYVTEPQACDDLSKWTILLGSSLVCGPQIENISFIIEAAGPRVGRRSPPTTSKKVLKWSDCCLPLACSPDQPFRAVAQASIENFTHLGVAFIEGRLQLDDGLVPLKIVPVLLQARTLSKLLEDRQQRSADTSTTKASVPETVCHHLSVEPQQLQARKGSLFILPEVRRVLEERRGSEPLPSSQALGPVNNLDESCLRNHHHMEGHAHHLHLSSCNECLELENSTILSVKYASAENIPDLLDDDSVDLNSVDEGVDELEHDAKGFFSQSKTLPNVLVYTGGSPDRFQAVRKVLSECLNVENNIIYSLQPQQALSDPWLDNTRLLVLAEDGPLTPELQTRFLTYLNQGGKVLGMGSALCPAGLRLEARDGRHMRVRRLSFTREDSTELEVSILASGKVYIRDPQGGGEVELWGELKSDAPHPRDMVIVRVTHGEDGGEAVLSQVLFDVAPESQNLDQKGFDELKLGNKMRHEILTEILSSLGLNCEANRTLCASPVHLLATSKEARTSFMKWLQTKSNQNTELKISKTCFRVVSSSECKEGPSSESSLALITAPAGSQEWPHFSFETYRKHLKSSLLGNTVLYAEVTTSTMDLLEGMTLHSPKDVGLIAIAARQMQGRGRGGNAWLSPLGCAMFTLQVQVELSSKLGQRIPFLQHLAALAVVEAVRTLPGYQDIDLRVKWPNDIYYSNLMKLGGVLVTSTVLGSTFYILIGCGINVTNSNPTVCINDLIQQYNRQNGCSLEPLSCSMLIARAVNCLETLIRRFQQDGPDAVLPIYYKRWLHSGTQVRLWSDEGPQMQVVGLDDNGFLQVYSQSQGVVSLEPDGNSFDMLRNLVVIKQR